jgi:hypothetical protein
LRGTCRGPVLALPLATALATVPPSSFVMLPDAAPTARVLPVAAVPLVSDLVPDPPPPRV